MRVFRYVASRKSVSRPYIGLCVMPYKLQDQPQPYVWPYIGPYTWPYFGPYLAQAFWLKHFTCSRSSLAQAFPLFFGFRISLAPVCCWFKHTAAFCFSRCGPNVIRNTCMAHPFVIHRIKVNAAPAIRRIQDGALDNYSPRTINKQQQLPLQVLCHAILMYRDPPSTNIMDLISDAGTHVRNMLL